jgi:aromatic ring-opening dioxygenase catalytic subunit (LigB family)
VSKMPTLFIPHGGGPCFFMDWDPPDTWARMAAFLGGVQADIGERPRAIVVISGHWEAPEITVQSQEAPTLLFDYYGFPEHTYELQYPAPGSPALAARIATLLGEAGFPVRTDGERGFDHGVFIPFKLAFPDADIPVVQLSLRADYDAAAHIAIGEALQPLRDEGVLIVGSGMTYHNMNTMMRNLRGGNAVAPGAATFDRWLTEAVTDPDPATRNRKLAEWSSAPAARDAHPQEEHLLPLHVVAGAAGSDVGRKTLEDNVLGTIESAFQFG